MLAAPGARDCGGGRGAPDVQKRALADQSGDEKKKTTPPGGGGGGVWMMYKSGHSLIKAKMKEISSPLGGEMSGHIFFKERWYGFDDGTYAGARLLEIVSRAPDAGALLNALPTS